MLNVWCIILDIFKGVFMKWISLGFIFMFVLCVGSVYADWEWWNEDEIVWKVKDRIELSFAAEQKLKNGMGEIYCYNFVSGLAYEFKEWLDLGINYHYEKEREYVCEDTWEDWLDEHRIQLEPTLKWKWGNFKFSDRNRFEYRILQERENKWRYRNRIKVKTDVEFCEIEFTPFCSEEIFIDFEGDGLYKNRLSVGVSKEFWSFLELELFYLLESCEENDRWHHSTNVLGTTIVISF